MGLDQYLSVRMNSEKSFIDKERDKQALYFRKNNWLHGYFQKKGEALGNEKWLVKRFALDSLVARMLIIGRTRNVEFAKKHLPTCEGFFFGCYEYDNDYFEKVFGGGLRIKEMMKANPDAKEFIYVADW